MKKILVTGLSVILVMGTIFISSPVRASTLTSSQIQAIISLLQSFGVDQATISNVQIALQGNSQSLATAMPQMVIQTTTERSRFVNQQAQIDFGGGLKKMVDIQGQWIKTNPTTSYSGMLYFSCFYSSHIPGLPDSCTPQPSDESSYASISSSNITVDVKVPLQWGGSIEKIEQVKTDASGNFSFTVPSICDIIGSQVPATSTQEPYELVTIRNGGYPVYSFNAIDTTATSSCVSNITGK